MSGDEMRGVDCVLHIAVEDGTQCDAADVAVTKTRRINVESYDEIYYPKVVIVREKMEVRDEQAQMDVSEPNTLISTIEKIDEPVRKKRGFRIWGSRLGALLMVSVALIAVVLVGMRLVGFRTFTVLSGSMEPEYPVGSMIYVRPVDYKNLKVGDVISYVANDEKTVVTHRIVDVEIDEKDAETWRFRTKGDANASSDAKLVHYKNVLGVPAITVPFIGYIAYNIQQPPGIYIALVVGTLLLAWTFLPDTLEERRKTARKSVA